MGNGNLGVKRPFKIITVFGLENSGKTTLIWNVFGKLLEDGGELTYFQLLGHDANDFHAIIVWKGKIIAICSIGDKADKNDKDDEKYIKDGIKVALENEAEILLNTMSDFSDKKNNVLTKTNRYEMEKKYKGILVGLKIYSAYKKFILKRKDTAEKMIKQKQIFCDFIINEMQK